jgi:PAS domain S-box-containing protein
MLFVNSSGQLVYGRAFDLQSEQEVPIPHSLEEYLNGSDLILNHPNKESHVDGVILLPEGPLLVASHPVLTSEYEGPINGTLIMGRYLDSVEVGRLGETARLSLTLQRLDEPETPYDFEQASSALSEDTPVFVQPLDKGLVAGYALIEDVYGEPVLMLRVDSPRLIYQQGQASMVYFMAFMFGASVVVGVVTLLLMGGLILSPLSRLSSSVSRIGASGDLLARVLMTGKDEMSGLASEINGMLEALKQSQEELKRSEEYFRALTENSSDSIVVLNSDGTARYVSPSFEHILGYKPEERIGQNSFEFVHPDDLGRVSEEFTRLMQEPGYTIYSEVRAKHKDGSWHVLDVIGNNLVDNPAVRSIVANFRDVTERRQMEEALRQSELLATATIEGMSDGVMLVSMDGKVTYINKAFEKLLGYSAGELVGTPAVELPTYSESKDKKKAREALLRVIAKGETEPIDMVGVTKDGNEIPISFSASVIKDAQGNPRMLVAVIRNITERKKTEDALKESERSFRTIFDNAVDGIVLADPENKKFYTCNKMFSQMSGYSLEEIKNLEVADIHPSEDLPYVIEQFNKQVRGEITLAENIPVKRKEGSIFYAEVNSSLIVVGGKSYIMGTFRDITERKKAEELLKRSEEYFRTLMDSSLDAITIMGDDGIIRYESPSYERLLGFKPEERVNSNLFERIHPDDIKRVAELFAGFLPNRGGTLQAEVRAQHKDGSWRFIEAMGSNLLDNPIVKGIVISLRDVTERKQAEEAIKRSEQYFKALVENAMDVITVIDNEGIIRYEADSIARVLGYKVEERVGKYIADFAHPDDMEILINAFNRLSQNPDLIQHANVRSRHKDGSWRAVEAVARNLLEYEAVKGIVLNWRDITERKRMEEALKESEERFRRLVNQAPDIIFRWSPDKGLEYVSPAVAQITGFSPEDLMADPMIGLELAKLSDSQLAEDYTKVVEERRSMRAREVSFVRKDGKPVHLDMRSHAIRDGKGEVVAYEGILRDITDRKLMEEAIKESEARYRLLAENVQDVISVVDMNLRPTYVSPSVYQLMGYTVEEAMARTLEEQLTPASFESIVKAFREGLTAGQAGQNDLSGSLVLEAEVYRKNGSTAPVEMRVNLLRDSDGQPLGILGVTRDITERKEAERRIKRNYEIQSVLNGLLRISLTDISLEKQLQLFLKHIVSVSPLALEAKGAIFLVEDDPDVLVLKAQHGLPESLLSMCGRVPFGRCLCGRAALSGEMQFADYVDERHENRYEGILQHGHYCVPILFGGKVLGVINLYVGEGHTRDGMEAGFLGAVSDVMAGIIQRKKAEEELRRLSDAVRMSTDSIVITDIEGTIIEVNEAALRMYGTTEKADLVGKNSIENIAPEDREIASAQLEKVIETEQLQSIEYRVLRKEGSSIPVETSVAIMRSKDGEPVGYVAVSRDITERKRMEQQLQSAGRLAAVGELAAGVAHELNNPLAAIQGYSQLLVSRNDLDELTKKDVDTIYREALRASKITKNLLSFARRHEPEKRYISINETVEKTLELRAHQMKVGNIELVTELQPDLPNTMADFYQLQQVFMNIVVNAEQAMSEAHGRGKLIVRTQKSGDVLQVSFIDNGPGISEENLKRIFDPFFTTKDVGKGTGLGLSICYGIVEAHKGRLYARSKPGEGASFFVEIPIVSDGQQA